MKIIFFIFFILFTLNHLQSSSTLSLLSSQTSLRVDNYWVDSLNMNMVGMWNFGYPCAIYAKDNYLYLGSGGCVIIFDLSESTNPEKIGDISFPGTDVRGIYVRDTLMFIGDGEKGLRIANISDPFQPIEIGSYGSYFSHSVFVRNNLAYVTELNSEIIGELVIYDISNPQEPHILSKDTLPEFHPNDVIVKDKYAYVANGQGGLRVIDISDSTNPFEISHFIPPIYGTYVNSLALCCDSILLFSAEPGVGNGGLWVINIKDPYDPYPMGCDTSFWVGLDVSYFSHYAYVSSAEDIKIIDFSTLSYPHIVGELHTPFALFNVVNTNIGSIIYAGEWRKNGLRTVNASDPTLPITIDYDIIPDLSIDVSVQGNYAYIANFYSGVYVLDISDPTNPKEISHYDTKSRSNSIITRDSIAYVADSASVLLLNIKNPYNPQMISELPLICDGFGMVLDYPYLYVTSELTHDFTIVNVSNPENPFITGSFHLNGFPTYICYKDTFAFVSVSLEGIAVINTANVYNPTLVTYLQLPGYARGNVCKGNFLYVATEDSSLICIVNLTDPSTPILENTVNTIQDYPFSITVSDTLLYVAEQFSGIEVFNISSSPSIQSVGYYIGDPLCIPLGITSEVGLAYLAADNGVFIFQYTGCSQIEANEIKRIGLKFPISLRCYPSTFSERVTIEITSVNEENIKLELFDVMGRNITNIFTGRMKGKRFFKWNGLNKNGDRVSSGIYFLRMWTENDNIQKKIIFIRN